MPRYVDAEKELAEMRLVMPRYIDADKAIEVIVNTPSMVGSKYDFDHNVLTALVDREHEITDLINNNVPTSDVAPVIHGHWIYQGLSRPYNCFSRCSCCGVVFDGYETFEYCPKCGAKMDEVMG